MDLKETLTTPVRVECDVLVCGGGVAGIAAALSAAREKKKVVLLDRGFMLGGLATSGLVAIYLALCDGFGRQVSFGVAEELLRLCQDVSLNAPACWLHKNTVLTEKDPRFEARFNPQIFAVMAEQLLVREGVTVLYGTYAVGAVRSGRHLDYVIAENKSGRCAIRAASVVDATGDADIAHFAGCACETFKQGNVLASWYCSTGSSGGYRLHPLGVCDIPDDQKTADNAVELLSPERFTGLDGEEISRYTQCAHNAFWNDYLKEKEKDPDREPVTLFTIPQLRMTRKLVGEYTLDDKETHKSFADSIGMVSDWRKRGPVYEVPFGTLYTRDCANLIMAGRCTSVTEPMWDIMRVIPCCAVTGQAAGCAAAMTDDFAALDVSLLQERLKRAGVVLHEQDLPL